MKKKYKLALLVFGIPFILFIILIKVSLSENEKDSDYYKTVGLQLNGTIKTVKELKYGHDYGVISIRLKYCNIKEYDKRNELERYFGVIKKDQAEIVFNTIGSIKVGDSIAIKIEKYELFRNGKLIDKNFIGMPPSSFIFTPFKEINRIINL